MKRALLLIFSITTINALSAQEIIDSISVSASVIGLEFNSLEVDSMTSGIHQYRKYYDQMRQIEIDNSVVPSLLFSPIPNGFQPDQSAVRNSWNLPENVRLPDNEDDLAWYSVHELAALIRDRLISSYDLTEFFLDRLHQFSDTLQCTITYLDSVALEKAKQADIDLALGRYKGPLHGIPYGIKDLFALPGYPTTWGASPYQNQMIAQTATVIEKLDDAGAILVAKLTLGALAMGDVWYGGKTRNPWDLKQGSSGSSAGSASATAAGLLPFAIGTETWGSIVSPSTRCGLTGLRPTFGRVSRYGAMALSWSMDKIGPMCRNAKDCALVFQYLYGKDSRDPYTIEASYRFDPMKDWKTMKVGYIQAYFENDNVNKNDSLFLEMLRKEGIGLEPIDLDLEIDPTPLQIILFAEAASAFDELTRTNRDTMLVRQIKRAWPNLFRQARLIPAVEYIQANRLRTMLINQLHEKIREYDVVITPSFSGMLLMTNLTGQPCVVLPNGFTEKKTPTSITIIGNLFEEGIILEFANGVQSIRKWHDEHPALFK